MSVVKGITIAAAALTILGAVTGGVVFVHDYFAKKAELEFSKCDLGRDIKILTYQVGTVIAHANATQKNSDIEREKQQKIVDGKKIANLTLQRDTFAEEFKEARRRERDARAAKCN